MDVEVELVDHFVMNKVNKGLKNNETFEEIAIEFLNFVREKKLIIHNAPFDIGFLNGELGLINQELIKKEQVIDSLEISRNKFHISKIPNTMKNPKNTSLSNNCTLSANSGLYPAGDVICKSLFPFDHWNPGAVNLYAVKLQLPGVKLQVPTIV